MRPGLAVFTFVAALVVTGCASLQSPHLIESPAPLPPRARVDGISFFPQQDHYCGPASLAMVLTWSGRAVSQEEIAPQLFTPGREGTFRTDLVGAARRHGRLAVPVRRLRGLLAELAAGHPVLVFQNLGLSWIPRWHYAVAMGYDLPAGDILLHTGRTSSRPVALRTFEHTWDRAGSWALVVLPPGRLPVSAGPVAVLKAGLGLEQAGRLRAAATAYAAVTRRWPQRLGGWLGLGNARYGLGDRAGAEAAFRAALRHRPEAAVAWNNLAVVLADRGKNRQAVAAARRAIRLGGDGRAEYRATLREVAGMGGGRASDLAP